jgi:hypothetical protein
MVGCGEAKQSVNTDANKSTRTKPVKEPIPEQKQKALMNSFIGEYEFKFGGNTHTFIFKENGILEGPLHGKKHVIGQKWEIVDGELHAYDSGFVGIWRINKDKSITQIAMVDNDGKRGDVPKALQNTFKRIK